MYNNTLHAWRKLENPTPIKALLGESIILGLLVKVK